MNHKKIIKETAIGLIMAIISVSVNNTFASDDIVYAKDSVKLCEEDEILCLTDGNGEHVSNAWYYDCDGNLIDCSSVIYSGDKCYTLKIGDVLVGDVNQTTVVFLVDKPLKKIAEIPNDNNQYRVIPCENGYLVFDRENSNGIFYNINGEEQWSKTVEEYHMWDLFDEVIKYPGSTGIYQDKFSMPEDQKFVAYGGYLTDPITGDCNIEKWIPYEIVDEMISVDVNDKNYRIPYHEGDEFVAVNNQYALFRGDPDGQEETQDLYLRNLETGEVIKNYDRSYISLGKDYYFIREYVKDAKWGYFNYKVIIPDGTDVVEKYHITGNIVPVMNDMLYVSRGPYIGLVDLEGNWIVREYSGVV